MESAITISRYWNNPSISITVNIDGISLEMKLTDFIEALKAEIGSVTTTFTRQQFSLKMDKAVESVVEKVKQESLKVV